MTEILHCLLTQKPEREPREGEIKCFTIEHKVSQNGKPWIKAKNATPDKGGQNYRILKVAPTGHTDQYQNVSYNIELEAVNGQQPQPATLSQAIIQNAPSDPVEACKGHLERCSKAMLMVMEKAVEIASDWEARTKSPMPPEHLQALCSTLFIQLSPTRRDHDYISALPIEEKEKEF